MKKAVPFLGFLLTLICLLIQGCSSDDDTTVVNSTPEFTSFAEKISSLPGENFIIEATLSDPAGIKTIQMIYEPWFFDKTIVKDSLPKTYDLAYRFKVPEDAEPDSSHTIPVIVTNAGGKTFTKEVVITLDKDITSPKITINTPTDGSTVLIGSGNEIVFDIAVTDNELAEFKIEGELLNETLPITETSYSYTKELNVEVTGSYTFTLTATDVSGNSGIQMVKVNVLDELAFDQMFITDVDSEALLTSDLFGVPSIVDASTVMEEDGYVFNAKFYASTANTEVRFIPQETSFEPFSFGANPDIPGELRIGSNIEVAPIVLPNIGYYEITMDLRDLTYSITPYTPADTPFDQIYILGTGVFVGDTNTCVSNVDGSKQCWHFASGKPFNSDTDNPYLWTLDVTLGDQPDHDGNNGFILNANPDNWGPFWRFDDGSAPRVAVPNGGADYVFSPEDYGDYTFIFDTHLNRAIVQTR